MALPTFPDFPPTRQSKHTREFRVLQAEFGDGYGQVVGDGLNTLIEEWTLHYDDYEEAKAKTILNFLNARKGVQSFLWKGPLDSAPLQWRQEGKIDISYENHGTLSLSFKVKRTYTND